MEDLKSIHWNRVTKYSGEGHNLKVTLERVSDNFDTLKEVIDDIETDFQTELAEKNVLVEVDANKILSPKASAVVDYGGEDFTITAVSKDVDGEDIIVEFVDPEAVDQTLAVAYDEPTKNSYNHPQH